MLQNFYEGLTPMSKGHVDAAARGMFFPSPSMEPQLSSKRWWLIRAGGKKENNKKDLLHTVKEADMLAMKMDLLLNRQDERAADKEAMKSTVQAMDSHMTCVVYGEVRHSGNDCPETREEASYINNGFRQQNNNGWNNQSRLQGGNNFNSNYNSNQPSLKDLILGR